ncbi:MAG: hypothetical protein ABIP55_10905, partial [Tepidisphaeraceae bacterium]
AVISLDDLLSQNETERFVQSLFSSGAEPIPMNAFADGPKNETSGIMTVGFPSSVSELSDSLPLMPGQANWDHLRFRFPVCHGGTSQCWTNGCPTFGAT